MDDVYAWVEEQRNINRRKFAQLLENGRQIWTPRNVFNTCCVKWLIDGRRSSDAYLDEYNPRNGCSSCNRHHPIITLGFDCESNSTTATLSHRLDPFLNYFDKLVAEGKAQQCTSTVYKLDGYLRPNFTALESYDGFGSHLIKIEDGAMDVSDALQTTAIEEGERAKKRQRVNSNGVDEEDQKMPPDMTREVMDVVMNERLNLDLQNDPLSLYCMRSVNKLFKNMAESIAAEKIKTLSLSITPLVNGKERYGEGMSKIDGYDSETFDVGCWDADEGPEDVVCYEKKEQVSLEYREDGNYYPTDASAAAATFNWDSGELNYEEEPDDPNSYECEEEAEYSTYAYRGQKISVYWHPGSEDPVKPKTRAELNVMTGRIIERRGPGILVAEIYLGRTPNVGNITKTSRYMSIDYEVIESNASEREEVDDDDDDDDDDGDDDSYNSSDRRRLFIRYSGTVRITKISVDYRLLVEKHARRVRAELHQRHLNIEKERPLTQCEKDYEKFVTSASGMTIR